MNNSYRCPLGKLIPETTDTEKLKRDAWSLHNILVISLDNEKLDFVDKQFIERIGNRLYGSRNKL